jgi:hypothetical protein
MKSQDNLSRPAFPTVPPMARCFAIVRAYEIFAHICPRSFAIATYHDSLTQRARLFLRTFYDKLPNAFAGTHFA